MNRREHWNVADNDGCIHAIYVLAGSGRKRIVLLDEELRVHSDGSTGGRIDIDGEREVGDMFDALIVRSADAGWVWIRIRRLWI